MQTELHHTPSLQQMLRQWLPWTPRKPATRVVAISLEPVELGERMMAVTVQQLVTSLRMQGIAGDDETMLNTLDSLVRAGEIDFIDFMRRLQNLFPDVLDNLDPTMRVKVLSLLRE